jgi:MoaA/NifB/PqqE/SkfB family radical SAM enzyme
MNEFRNHPNAHKNAIIAIENILSLNEKPEVTCIPTKINYKEMPQIAKYLDLLGLNTLRYMPFIGIGRGRKNYDKLHMDVSENAELMWMLRKTSYALGGFKFDYGDPLEHIYLFRNNSKAFTPAYEIKSNGDIQITCYLPFIYGNALNVPLSELWVHGLKDIWRSELFFNTVKEINTVADLDDQQLLPYNNEDTDLFELRNHEVYSGNSK